MKKTLHEIMKDIESLQENAIEELAIPVQELVNMVNNKEIKSYSLIVKTVKEIGISPYSFIIAKIDNPAIAILGAGEGTSDEIFGYNKNINTELKEKLLKINSNFYAINKFLNKSLPLNENKNQDHLYFYSLDRKNLKKSWNEEEAKKWPMLPAYLENFIDLDNNNKKNKIK